MRSQSLTFRSFYLNSPADEGVAAVNRWAETAGYPDALWKGQQAVRLQRATGGDEAAAVGVTSAGQYGATTYGTWPEAPLSQEMIFDRCAAGFGRLVTGRERGSGIGVLWWRIQAAWLPVTGFWFLMAKGCVLSSWRF